MIWSFGYTWFFFFLKYAKIVQYIAGRENSNRNRQTIEPDNTSLFTQKFEAKIHEDYVSLYSEKWQFISCDWTIWWQMALESLKITSVCLNSW